MKSIAIIGTVGIPACYGGFETLAENLARFHSQSPHADSIAVYCSSKSYKTRINTYLGARLRYVGIPANGVFSILYDVVCTLHSALRKDHAVLILGVSGAVAIPFLRLLTRTKIITNIDGIEWRRAKWGTAASWFLRLSERLAVTYSHVVVADNQGIADHVEMQYGKSCEVIAYGGDHAMAANAHPMENYTGPAEYALALCRIEPENNVALILEAFSKPNAGPLIFVGNWNNSDYGRSLRQKYSAVENINLLDPIYDVGTLKWLRESARVYIHGHSAGGTNPSLVEMMHFGVPILAYDCSYNRYTTENKALYFSTSAELAHLLTLTNHDLEIGHEMARIARARYTWDRVAQQYFSLLSD